LKQKCAPKEPIVSENKCAHPDCGRKFGLVRHWLYTFRGYAACCSLTCKLDYKRKSEQREAYVKWLYGDP
jgi:hypothetical protein